MLAAEPGGVLTAGPGVCPGHPHLAPQWPGPASPAPANASQPEETSPPAPSPALDLSWWLRLAAGGLQAVAMTLAANLPACVFIIMICREHPPPWGGAATQRPPAPGQEAARDPARFCPLRRKMEAVRSQGPGSPCPSLLCCLRQLLILSRPQRLGAGTRCGWLLRSGSRRSSPLAASVPDPLSGLQLAPLLPAQASEPGTWVAVGTGQALVSMLVQRGSVWLCGTQ